MVKKLVAAVLVAALIFPATASAEPQCWDRYSQQNAQKCGGDPNAPGGFPGAGGGGGGGGGLLGIVHRLTGGLL